MKLAGRAAIITGASMGFGLAIADKFLSEGARVLICARDGQELFKQQRVLQAMHPRGEVHAVICDMGDMCHVLRLFSDAIELFGSVQIVVNNAGIYGPMGKLETVRMEDWQKTIDINLLGPVYLCCEAVRHFKQQRYGKIINISGGGATNPLPGLSAYAASKAGLVRFTETLAMECIRDQVDANTIIDINSVAPGPLATRMADQVIEAGPDKVGQMLYERTVLLRNNGGTDPKVGAELCAYLASAESDGVTGKLIAAVWDKWPFDDEAKAMLREDNNIYTLRRVVNG